MRTHIARRFVELVFNLDEVDSSDLEDRKHRKVIAPRPLSADDIYYPVSCCYPHVTFIVCVSAAGNALASIIVLQSPIRDSLWNHGLRQN
jgi:hypothetical protein